MFRGKESSNRIELSRLVQDLLNFWCFGLPAALGVGEWMDGGGGGWGVPPTHVHIHAHVKHDNFMQMATPIGGIPGIPYDIICTCVCVCMHVHMCGGTLSPPPTPIHPAPHPQGGPPESVKIQ